MWTVIESHTEPAAALNWKRRCGDSFDAAAAAFLRQTQRVAPAIACVKSCGCSHRVVRRGSGYAGVCDCGEECDEIELAAADVRVLELNVEGLGRRVAAALSWDFRLAKLPHACGIQIAVVSAESTPVILSLPRDEREFHDVVGGGATAEGICTADADETVFLGESG